GVPSPLVSGLLGAPAPAISRAQDLVRRDDGSIRRSLHAERTRQLVHDVLIGRRDASAHRLLTGALGALPVGVDVSARVGGAPGGGLRQPSPARAARSLPPGLRGPSLGALQTGFRPRALLRVGRLLLRQLPLRHELRLRGRTAGRSYFFADAICAWMPSIVFKWSSSVGSWRISQKPNTESARRLPK